MMKNQDTTSKEYSLPLYDAVLEFLVGSPSPQEIVNYRPPAEAQRRFSELLEANRQGALTLEDEEELNHYIRIDRMMSLLKAKAYRRLDSEAA